MHLGLGILNVIFRFVNEEVQKLEKTFISKHFSKHTHIHTYTHTHTQGSVSLVAQWKRICLPMQIWVQSLGWEDPLEREMATHSSILA